MTYTNIPVIHENESMKGEKNYDHNYEVLPKKVKIQG